MRKIILSILLFLFCIGCTKESAYKKIDGKEATRLIKKGAIILDVRSTIEYEQGHIKGAIQIPYYEVDTLTYSKNSKIIVYCRTGSRSKKAADLLLELGYQHIYDLGSIDNYKEAIEK